MRVAVDRNDQLFLKQLHRMCGGSVQDICETVGVTATAVRQRLTRLEAGGLVVRETVRAGRGRPRHVYRISDSGLRHLGENYRDLALVLWRTIHQISEPEFRTNLLGVIRDQLVQRYRRVSSEGPLESRVQQLQEELVSQGYDFEIDSNGVLPILRETNCPYQDLASVDSSICEMESDVFSRILDADVSLTQCCLDGHAHCEFQISEKSDGNSELSPVPVQDRRK
jgi:predicted ArsR family transcriptional regulator